MQSGIRVMEPAHLVNVSVTARVYRNSTPHTIEVTLDLPQSWPDLAAIPTPEQFNALLQYSLENDQVAEMPRLDHEELEAICGRQRYCKATVQEGDDSSCAICLNDFRTRAYVRRMPCDHVFCSKCVEKWATQHCASCPVCRAPIS